MPSRFSLTSFILIGFAVRTGCGKTSDANSSPAANSSAPTEFVPSEPSAITTARNGVLAEYNTTTVGKTFEGTFQNPKWTTFETPKGQTAIQFDGTLTALELTQNGFLEFGSAYKTAAAPLVDGCIEKPGLAEEKQK
jgi:hypothetical protein